MSDLNQSLKQLVAVLADEAKEITAELKDISTEIDAELDLAKKSSNHND
jgi:hypothetical protein